MCVNVMGKAMKSIKNRKYLSLFLLFFCGWLSASCQNPKTQKINQLIKKIRIAKKERNDAPKIEKTADEVMDFVGDNTKCPCHKASTYTCYLTSQAPSRALDIVDAICVQPWFPDSLSNPRNDHCAPCQVAAAKISLKTSEIWLDNLGEKMKREINSDYQC
jgi:hypothetical protein